MLKFEKYRKIHNIGHEENKDIFKDPEDEIIIEEKIDGANMRFQIKEDRMIFGSRLRALGDDRQEIGGNWKLCVNYIKEKLKDKNLKPYEGYIIYGECITKHTLNYDWDRMPPYLGFDIKTEQGYLDHDKKAEIFRTLGLPTVPLVKKARAGELKKITDEDIPRSAYVDNYAEGIVFKNYGKQIMAKYVSEKFKEENKKAWAGGKKFEDFDDDRLVAMYGTDARIEKTIYKLRDDGSKIDMAMMKNLPKAVINDIIEEHASDICWSKWCINFKNFRKKISKKCFKKLQWMMQEEK